MYHSYEGNNHTSLCCYTSFSVWSAFGILMILKQNKKANLDPLWTPFFPHWGGGGGSWAARPSEKFGT